MEDRDSDVACKLEGLTKRLKLQPCVNWPRCVPCTHVYLAAKDTKQINMKKREAKKPLELVHHDIYGPIYITTPNENTYSISPHSLMITRYIFYYMVSEEYRINLNNMWL